MNKTGKCYVYVYLNPLKPGKYCYEGSSVAFLYEPFYVGKGTNNRMYQHINHSDPGTHKYNTIKKIQLNGYDQKDYIIKVADGMSDAAALAVEAKLVKLIGRRWTKEGPLVNISAGGGGSITGTTKKRSCKIKDAATKNYIVHNYTLGKSIYYLAKELELSQFVVKSAIVEAGVEVVNKSNVGVGIILSENRDYIKQMIKAGVKVADIAKMFNTSRQTIYTFMEQNHIPSRLQMSRGEVA